MIESVLGLLRKRRRIEEPSDDSDASASVSVVGGAANAMWNSLFHNGEAAVSPSPSSSSSSTANPLNQDCPLNRHTSHEQQSSIFYNNYNYNNNYNNDNIKIIEHIDRPFELNERFVTVLDQLDARVEKYRKDALGLQEKRDFLLMSIDLIKSHDLLTTMSESEREEITCYIQRVNSRLSTVELNVRTVRDGSQEDALSQINALIDLMITMGDPVMARQRCQQYLNACCSAAETGGGGGVYMSSYSHQQAGPSGMIDMDAGPVDKKFESVLLGCTLDDQKNIKKRLQALMDYLNKQTVQFK